MAIKSRSLSAVSVAKSYLKYLHSFLEWMVDHDKVTPSIRKNLKKLCHGVLVLLARYKNSFKLKET